jgi:hypothetical protein
LRTGPGIRRHFREKCGSTLFFGVQG